MKVLKLILASVFLSSCITTKGIKEPMVVSYVIVDKETAECIPPDYCKDARKLSTMIGFQCVDARASALINNHHEVLHKELNKRNANP